MSHLVAPKRRTLLEYVLANDIVAVARELEVGADVNMRDGRKWSALHVAAFCRTTAIAAVLVDSGAELDAREENALTPLHVCCQKKSNIIALMLMERGVDPEARTNEGRSPLHLCSQHGSTEIARMLIDKGADLEAKADDGLTPLHTCSQFGTTEVASVLVESGANVDAKTNNGRTPLHICSQHGKIEIAKMLAERAVDLQAKDNEGWSPGGVPAETSDQMLCDSLQTDDYQYWPFYHVMPEENWFGIRDILTGSLSLAMQEEFLLHPIVQNFDMELGWSRGTDLDAWVALLGPNLELLDIVWHVKLSSECRSIRCSEKRDEATEGAVGRVISVNLANIPTSVHHLLFCVSNHNKGSPSDDEISGYIRMVNWVQAHNYYREDLCCSRRKMFSCSVQDMSTQSTVMGVWTRKGPLWSFKALGRPATGCTIEHLLVDEANLESLADCHSWEAEYRKVTVTVVKGRGRAAKNKATLLTDATSYPYYTIKFKNKKYKSECIPKTLDPKWEVSPFELGMVTEAETAPLVIKIFNFNYFSNDSNDVFMGAALIPGSAFYRLGPGEHAFWFLLGYDEKKCNEDIGGHVLIHIRIEGCQQNSAPCHHPSAHPETSLDSTLLHETNSMTAEQVEQAPRESGVSVNIMRQDGTTLVTSADLVQELLHAIPNVLRKNSIPLPVGWQKIVAGGIPVEAIQHSRSLPGDTGSQAMLETETEKKKFLVSTHQEQRPEKVDIDAEEQQEEENSQTTSDEEASSLSKEMWIPDEPYGSRGRLLKAVRALKRDQDFADDYTMGIANFADRPHLRLAKQKFQKKDPVVLKFYWEEASMENGIEMHSKVAASEHVCRIVQTFRTKKTDLPPCIAFEKGARTLREWLRDDRPLFDRRWCLHQILNGLRDLHARGIVHCDVKPSNVVFFPDSVAWKIIDLDGAQKAGESRVVCFTAQYAAPEVLKQWQEEGELPVAQKASDIWSCEILAYEVLTGRRMFGDDLTHDEICELVLEGRVEEKLNSMTNDSHREAISNFLKLNLEERWSAGEALQHVAFNSNPQTTTTQISQFESLRVFD